MSAVLNIEALEAQAREFLVTMMRAKLCRNKWLDITAFSKLDALFDADAEKAARGCREYKLLHALHCQDFADMSEEMRAAIPALVEAVIEAARADIEKRQVQS